MNDTRLLPRRAPATISAILGQMRSFHRLLRRRHDTRFGLAETNGTGALEVALKAIYLPPGAR